MKHLSWIFTLPITVIVILFAVTNRSPATLSFWPLPWTINLPIYLIILGTLFVGFLLGVTVAWASGSRRRRHARQLAERLRAQDRQILELQRRQQTVDTAPPPSRTVPAPASAAAPTDERRIARVS